METGKKTLLEQLKTTEKRLKIRVITKLPTSEQSSKGEQLMHTVKHVSCEHQRERRKMVT
jgi:hypothetical protein